jgi:hypothetical protein
MKTVWVVLVIVAVLIAAGVVFVWLGVYNVAADQPHWKITSWFLEEVRERSIAVRSQDISPPSSVSPKMVENATYYYYGTCDICHGAPGNPPDKFSRGLDPTPPDFASPNWDMPEEAQMFWIIKNGIKMTAMASFGEEVFKDDEIWAMVHFLKNLHKKAEKSKQG